MKSKRAREAATEPDPEDVPTDKKQKRKRDDDEAGAQVKRKKAKKDKNKGHQQTRKEKKDKRKDLQDLPDEDVENDAAGGGGGGGGDAPASRGPKSDKGKSARTSDDKPRTANGKRDGDGDGAGTEKQRKKNKAAGPETKDTAAKAAKQGTGDEGRKKQRHIVFVGNLPFSATAETIRAHFASLGPISVRCLRNKGDANPCRGIAFVEFPCVRTMSTCLDKFHHTVFEDGVSAGRKINVELTAGGGGGTKFRKDKIREKNKKLDENRSKRIEKEKAAKVEGGGAAKEERDGDGREGGIHPSRLAMNPSLAK
ncbi:hypothetical protein EsDP_00006571 [Epichloe bromicola]|uniref:RRM domain-containing protein n=1 Tax=Epichloe bromicola TaxID=79588 RepID=A0ABQ0CY14_9HYPO